MAFTVSSNSFKDGDYLAKAHILSAEFRFRQRRRQQVAAPGLVGGAGRDEELRRHLLRPGRPHRQRVLALAGGEYSAQRR